MCGQFEIKISLAELGSLALADSSAAEKNDINPKRNYFPKQQAPIVRNRPQGRFIEWAQFGLVPHWSKEFNLKFSTYNARIETILEKATWRDAAKTQHAVVGVSAIVEAARGVGEFSGQMIRVEIPAQQIFFLAALYSRWRDPATAQERGTFAIITEEPCPKMQSFGHDRQPLVLQSERLADWLVATDDPIATLGSLKVDAPEWSATSIRHLKT